MSRIARKHQVAVFYIFHLLNRGILRQVLFHDDEDYSYFLQILRRYKQKASFLVYHWCLMPNHYHLVAEFPQPSLISKIIGACQQIYALYYHRKYQTAGRLFQNRFKSQAIEKGRYFIASGRYVELNPVRAKLAERAWDWKWSSARFYVSGEDDDLVSIDPEWKKSKPQVYKDWLEDIQAAELGQEIFRSSQAIIGGQNLKRNTTVKDFRSMKRRRRGRPKNIG